MSKNRPLHRLLPRTEDAESIPTLDAFGQQRRRFLVRVTAAGVGAALMGLDLTEARGSSDPAESYTVRFPRTEFASCYLSGFSYLRYAIKVTTTTPELAAFLEAPPAQLITDLGSALSGFRCDDVTDVSKRARVESALQNQVVASYQLLTRGPVPSVHQLAIEVHSCDLDTRLDGFSRDPSFP